VPLPSAGVAQWWQALRRLEYQTATNSEATGQFPVCCSVGKREACARCVCGSSTAVDLWARRSGQACYLTWRSGRTKMVRRPWGELRRHEPAPLLLPLHWTSRWRHVVVPRRAAVGASLSTDLLALGDERDQGDQKSPRGPPSEDLPAHQRMRSVGPKLLVEHNVVDTLAACIRRTGGLPSRRQLGKYPSLVAARVVGISSSQSRAIV